MTRYRNIWRHPFELYAAIGWGLAAIYTGIASGLISPNKAMLPLAVLSAGLMAYRLSQAKTLIDARLSLASASGIATCTRNILLKVSGSNPDSMLLGLGWEWERRHAQRAAEILQRNHDEMPRLPQWILYLAGSRGKEAPTINGAPWIHGLEAEERYLFAQLSALAGHTLVVGTTGSGKTRLYEILTTQAIHAGTVVIVLDPKGDKDWEMRMRKECAQAGREFLYFHPAFPSKSVRLNPLKNWHNPTEIASRIAQLLPSEGGGDAFVQFAWMTIDRIVNGLLILGIRPDIQKIKHYTEAGVDEILDRLLDKYFLGVFGADWEKKLAAYIAKSTSRLHGKVSMYVQEGRRLQGNEVIDGLINTFAHDKEHFGKMILSLLPLLQMLTSGEMGELLSPDAANVNDKRPISDMEKIVRGGKVLYVGLDSLSNKQVGSAIGSIMLADLAAVAGATYNYGGARDVYLYVDEGSDVVNDQFLQILNKGRGAGFTAFLATQTIADLEARLGSKAKATQMLGNANNVIALRVRDTETAEHLSEMFGETTVTTMTVSHSHHAESEANILEFGGSVTRSLKDTKAPLVSKDLLMRLSNLQFFSLVSGKVYKGRVPVISN